MAGHLKFAAIILAAGLLAGACSDGGSPKPAPTTTPPPSTLAPVATPTLPPELDTTSGIDTSGWLTFASPLGVTMSYPPDWTFVGSFNEAGEHDPEGTHTVLHNGVLDDTGEAGGTPGVAHATVRAYPGGFDPELLLAICIVSELDPYSGGPDFSKLVTIDGRRAVFCEGHNLTPARLNNYGFTLWIEMQDGQIVEMSAGGVGPAGNDLAVARAIIESATVTSPPMDTSGWPTFSSPLGFDMKYPPGWTIVDSGQSEFPEERVRIYNELTYSNYEERLGTPARGYLPELGQAFFDIWPDPLPYFDVADLIGTYCPEFAREDESRQTDETTVDGHRAVRCVNTGLALGGEHQLNSTVLLVEQPLGRWVHIGYTVVGGDQDIIAAAEAALATITFRE